MKRSEIVYLLAGLAAVIVFLQCWILLRMDRIERSLDSIEVSAGDTLDYAKEQAGIKVLGRR